MRMLNRNPKRLSAEVFSSAQKQPKQNASSQNREENGSTTLRNTREKPLLAGYKELHNDNIQSRGSCYTRNRLRESPRVTSPKGTGHYLSAGTRGGGGGNFRGDHLIFRRTKGEISRN